MGLPDFNLHLEKDKKKRLIEVILVVGALLLVFYRDGSPFFQDFEKIPLAIFLLHFGFLFSAVVCFIWLLDESGKNREEESFYKSFSIFMSFSFSVLLSLPVLLTVLKALKGVFESSLVEATGSVLGFALWFIYFAFTWIALVDALN